MLQLASVLHSRGFSITIIHTHFNSPAKSKHPHFTFLPISHGLSPTGPSRKDVISFLTLLNSDCVAPFRDCLAGLLEDGPIACLITDAVWHFSQSVADGVGIPRIVLRTSSVSFFLVYAALPMLREKGYLPKQGHINPMLQLANILHSRGFSITIIHAHFNSPAKSKHPHFTFLPISDGLSPTEAPMGNIISFLTGLNSNCVAPFRDCLTGLLADGPIACLITDAIWHFSQSVADGFGIPRIVLRTSSVSSFLVYAAFPTLQEMGYLPKQSVGLLSSLSFFICLSGF
ncbi:hypothetical protein RHSIM_Rhsim09G0169800 [Rhododendron simsii]|uniref:Uncharacterized protein n=1 Tax=Rhododendron simsii TaxID=118357 RepID=A0A834GCA8_RHOSS|nr:hypothetical protein RHSIM_Rhsim09G0169800 [Rhododendron simsii]